MKEQAQLSSLANLAQRLLAARRQKKLNQTEFAALGGVGLNSQSRYEQGETEPGALYLTRLAQHDVDVHYVLTGKRIGDSLDHEQSELLDAFNDLARPDRVTLLRLAASLAGRPVPRFPLPSTAALEDAFGGLLDGSPGMIGDELAHELATQLPMLLQAASDEIAPTPSDQLDDQPAPAAGPSDGRRASRQGQRT